MLVTLLFHTWHNLLLTQCDHIPKVSGWVQMVLYLLLGCWKETNVVFIYVIVTPFDNHSVSSALRDDVTPIFPWQCVPQCICYADDTYLSITSCFLYDFLIDLKKVILQWTLLYFKLQRSVFPTPSFVQTSSNGCFALSKIHFKYKTFIIHVGFVRETERERAREKVREGFFLLGLKTI